MSVLNRLLTNRRGNRPSPRRAAPTVELLEDRWVPSGVSAITSNFNGTAIPAGSTVWFSSAFKVNGLGTSPVTLHVTNQTISFSVNGANQTEAVPDSLITLSPTATLATTTFDTANNTWDTTLPFKFSGNAFLGGVAVQVPNGLPGGINPVTWQGQFSSSAPGLSVNWQWAAAVYSNFSTSYLDLGVKPVDDNHVSQYQNSDHAGTPEAFKQFVLGGARGGGGSNYTGSMSGTASVSPPLFVPPPPPPPVATPSSLSGFAMNQVTHTGFAGVTITLTGTDSLGNSVTLTTTTALDGSYSFTGLAPGNYTLTATIPTGYVDFGDMVGTVNGVTDGTRNASAPAVLSSISLNAGDNGINYDFSFGVQTG